MLLVLNMYLFVDNYVSMLRKRLVVRIVSQTHKKYTFQKQNTLIKTMSMSLMFAKRLLKNKTITNKSLSLLMPKKVLSKPSKDLIYKFYLQFSNRQDDHGLCQRNQLSGVKSGKMDGGKADDGRRDNLDSA